MPLLGGGVESGLTPGDRGRHSGRHHHGEDSQRREALDAGATGFLTKDVSMQDVVRTVHQAAGGDVALSPELAGRAAMIAAACRLRGSDACYVAVSELHGARLLTWDLEMLQRGATLVEALSPTDYLKIAVS